MTLTTAALRTWQPFSVWLQREGVEVLTVVQATAKGFGCSLPATTTQR